MNQDLTFFPLNHEESASRQLSSLLFVEPTLYYAKLHQKSTKLGFIPEESPQKAADFCPCCGISIEKQLFPLNCSNSLLKSEISFSYYIFLKLIQKILKFLLLPYFLIVTIPEILLIILNDESGMIKSDRKPADLIFLLYFLVFSKVFLPFWLNKDLAIYYKTNKSLSFLTIFLSNLPKKWTKDELKTYLEEKFQELLNKKVEIERIVSFKHCEALRYTKKKDPEMFNKTKEI